VVDQTDRNRLLRKRMSVPDIDHPDFYRLAEAITAGPKHEKESKAEETAPSRQDRAI